MSGAKPSVVLGTIGSDAHVVGVTLLEHALEEAGFEVRNLGAQVSRERFGHAAAEHGADAVLVSSMDGHAEQNCEGLHEALAAADVDPVTFVGGNLSVGEDDLAAARERFRAMGFDAVFGPTAGFEEAVAALRDHLGLDEHATATEPERARVR